MINLSLSGIRILFAFVMMLNPIFFKTVNPLDSIFSDTAPALHRSKEDAILGK